MSPNKGKIIWGVVVGQPTALNKWANLENIGQPMSDNARYTTKQEALSDAEGCAKYNRCWNFEVKKYPRCRK